MVQHVAFAVVELCREFVEQGPVVAGWVVGEMFLTVIYFISKVFGSPTGFQTVEVADGLELLVIGVAEVVYDGVVRDLVYPG